MISPVYYLVAGLSFFVIYLVTVILDLRKKVQKPETVYIDTSGIEKNPPVMLETWQNKTINIKVNEKVCVSIPHFKALDCLKYIKRIAYLYRDLLRGFEDRKIHNDFLEAIESCLYMAKYRKICKYIYTLSKPFTRRKFRYKRAFFKRAYKDFNFILGACEEIIDYWSYVKKKLIFLASGTTERQMGMVGGISTVAYSIRDGNLKTSITPRFALSSNTSLN